jgi:hypothetical protein
VLEQARALGRPTFFIDSGEGLFGSATLPEEAVPQQERKARALAQALTAMKLDVRQPGPLDDARGAAFRAGLKLPELDGVWVQSRGGFTLGVVSGASAAELAARAKQARAQGASFVLGLFPGPFDRATEAAQGSGVDLVVAARAKDEVAGETSRLNRGAPPVAQLQSKGRSLLKVEVWSGAGDAFELLHGAADQERELAALDERIEMLKAQTNDPTLSAEMRALRQQKLEELERRRETQGAAPLPAPRGKKAFAVRFVPLETNVPMQAEVKAIVDAYDDDVGRLNLQWAKAHGRDCPKPGKAEAGFIGNEPCRECHKEAFPVWASSKHAHGYATLKEKKKQYHLDCIGCHVTGWQKPGGVCRVDVVAGREGVGCESCHGPGLLHADDPSDANIAKGDDPKLCVSCHDRENSPHFVFEKYLPQILGPGHGAAAGR